MRVDLTNLNPDHQTPAGVGQPNAGSPTAEVTTSLWMQCLTAITLVSLAAVVRWLLDGVLGERIPYSIFYIAVVLVAWRCGRWPTLLTITLGGLTAHWLFVSPRHHVVLTSAADVVGFAVFLVAGGTMAGFVRALRQATRRAEASAAEALSHERSLLASEERLRHVSELSDAVIDNIEAIVIVLDREGRLVRFNAGCQRITGWSASEVLGRRFWEFLIPEDQLPGVRAVFDSLTAGAFPSRYENGWLTRDGRQRWLAFTNSALLDADGKVEYIISSGIDLTERRQAEASLSASEARITAIFRSSPAAIAITRLSDGKFLEVNPAVGSMLDYTREELMGRTSVELGLWADPGARERCVQLVSAGGAVNDIEFQFRRKNGTLITAEYSGMLAEFGGEHCLLSSFVDVTERKMANEALRESREHYQALAERNRRLLQELEHRVRNNIAGLLGLISAMQAETKDVPAFAKAIESRLLGMANVQTLLVDAKWGNVELRTLISSTLATMEPLSRYRTPLEIDGPAVWLQPDMVMPLALVLVEWVTNSCKYGAHSAPDGRLSIRWSACGEGRPLRLTWTERGGPRIQGSPVPSLGTTLVKSFVERDLRGRCEMRYPEEGAEHQIEIPCPPG